MSRPEYHSGNFYAPSPMVNGNYHVPTAAPGFVQAPYQPVFIVRPPYQTHQVALSGPRYPYYQHVTQTYINTSIPPPTNQRPIGLQSIKSHLENAVKRQSHAVKIVHPVTKKDILEDLRPNNHQEIEDFESNNHQESSLRETAEEFVPTTHCPSSIDVQSTIIPDTDVAVLTAQDTVDLNETLSSDELNAGLSFENTEENPSLTASIKQIPSILEQKLIQDDELQYTSNFKTIILPQKQESHSSLPDAFRNEPSRKRSHESFSQSPQYSHNFNEFHQFHPRNFGPRSYERGNIKDYRHHQNNSNRFPFHHRNQHQQPPNRRFTGGYDPHNNERDYHRTASERNLSTIGTNPPSYHHNRTYPANSSEHQKVDQECTAHPTKDLNQNHIISEPEQLKETTKLDENNNEVTEESVNLTELSLMESTTENSETSLNQSQRHKYSTKKLAEIKKSPLVLSKPPALRDGILDSSMNKTVWNLLFDKKNRIDENSYEDNNSSLQNNKSNYLKKTHSNLRYETSQNQLSRNKSGSDKQMIKMNLSIKEDVKLNEAESAWKPTHMKNPEAMDDKEREIVELLKNFRSLLNKITEENFEHLVKEINDKRKYVINSPEKLSAIVKLLFEKSISEPGYASTYAKLCHALSTVHLVNEEVVAASKKTTNPWKIYLISHCQQEFERSKKDDVIFKSLQDSINKASDTEEIANYEELYFKIRQRANGTVKFIGELYKMNMLTASIMVKCIDVLITSVTEENIERLCKLLTTVGQKLEGELKSKSDMDKYMQQLSKLRNSNVITTQRIKFDIMNVIDLRNSGWRQRENARSLETKPQKLQDLQAQEDKKKRLMQQQLNDYQPKINHNNNNNNNNLGRQRSQRSFDDGFRPNNSKQFDFNKINIPKTNANAEITLGPQRNFFQNFQKAPPQMQPPPTRISNPYANLLTDCDDVEQLPTLHRTSSGGKNSRKDKKNNSHSNGNNKEKQKARTPSPVAEKPAENNNDDDDFFMIDLTVNEEKDMQFLTDKMQQTFKAKITFDMMVTDLKKIKITKNVLGQVFTDLFDKKSCERKELIELVGEICRKGLITKVVNIDALKLAVKSIPTVICDVPLAYDYFSEYCAYFYDNGLITKMEEIESICQNQQNILDKIKRELETSKEKKEQKETKIKEQPSLKSGFSVDLNQSEEIMPPKVKKEVRCLQQTMEFVKFKLKKQKKSSFLEEIYSKIDKEKCTEASNFIKDLTLTVLKFCYEGKGKKTADMSKLFPLFIRYIDNDMSNQIDCINTLNEFAFSNPSLENCNLCKLFDLFYDNDVISKEAFNIWKRQDVRSKHEALKQTTSFLTRLEEADTSDELMNCTSSTIKED